ncbi:MAG TPA: hypothetical protein ENG83_10225 [Nitrospirae bacterium]|nr:hypothetical protein BMS3Abin06_01205 [bacterium BMS3Abin06]HDH12549.1 hypothetical protein [Nitrospirota bacterium]HDZ00708.1 hypothetical protein [Nitrospirota bacterium]
MPFELRYHPDLKDVDIPALNKNIKNRIKKAIETRLTTEPHMERTGEDRRGQRGQCQVLTQRGQREDSVRS